MTLITCLKIIFVKIMEDTQFSSSDDGSVVLVLRRDTVLVPKKKNDSYCLKCFDLSRPVMQLQGNVLIGRST